MTDVILAKRVVRLTHAIAEAERFVDRANEAVAALRRGDGNICGSIHVAAAKRASMDLTRALADVRRNPYNDA